MRRVWQAMLSSGIDPQRLKEAPDKPALYSILARTSSWQLRTPACLEALQVSWQRGQAVQRIQALISGWLARTECKRLMGHDVKPYLWNEHVASRLREILYAYDRRCKQSFTRVDWEDFIVGFKENPQAPIRARARARVRPRGFQGECPGSDRPQPHMARHHAHTLPVTSVATILLPCAPRRWNTSRLAAR